MDDATYASYVDRYRRLRHAIDDGDPEALLALEAELRGLAVADRRAASLALFDVAAHLPPRGPQHLARLLEDAWPGEDDAFFLRLLESMNAEQASQHGG